ncbi:MAG: CRISPR-associated endoribonuclease Cas6 [Ignavibacteria bacterium]|nr:CRISPR-associated endoribonuclease Cas6 [Ignavibacteria bacterium]
MRLKISLVADYNKLTCNFNYSFSAAIYKMLNFGSPEFAAFLHDIGYPELHKNYKLFSFALEFEKFKAIDNELFLISPNVTLYVTSPLIDDFLRNFVIGAFQNNKISITSHYNIIGFSIKQIEALPQPYFTQRMNYRMLSPLVLSTGREYNGELKQYFLRYTDSEDINRVLTNNLISKYKILRKRDYSGGGLELEWDREYIQRKKRVSVKITINENALNSVDIIGIRAPFSLRGSPELMEIGYEAGFGEKNSMGFGLVSVI